MVNQIAKLNKIRSILGHFLRLNTVRLSYQPSSDTVGGVVEHMCNSDLAADGLLWTDGAQEMTESFGKL